MLSRIIAGVVALAMAAGTAIYFATQNSGEKKNISTKQASAPPKAPVRFELPDEKEMGESINAEDIDAMIAETPDTIATIAGTPIKKDEYVRALKGLSGNLASSKRGMPKVAFENIKKNILNNVIDNRVIFIKAKEKGLAASAEEVDSTFESMKARFPDEAAFDAALGQQGMTVEMLKADMTEKLTARKLLDEELFSKIDLSDERIKAYYDANSTQFIKPESVRASHILIKTAPPVEGADDSANDEAKKKIDGISKQLSEGADFAALAKEHSQDPGSAQNGGDLGPFSKGRMVPEFEKVAFELEPGKISEPVKTQFGYHLIKVEEKIPAGVTDFETVKPQITQRIRMEEAQKLYKEYVEKLRGDMDIKISI